MKETLSRIARDFFYCSSSRSVGIVEFLQYGTEERANERERERDLHFGAFPTDPRIARTF